MPACAEAGLPFHRRSGHAQPLYASASRKQQAERAWSLSVSDECPVHSIAGNLSWEPSDFHMKKERLGGVLWRIHPSGLDGLGACPSVRPGSEGQLGRRPVPGLRTAIRTAGSSRTDSGGSPPASRLGMKSGNPLRQAVWQALMFGFAEQEIDSGVQRVGDADECGVVGFVVAGDAVVHPGSADAYAIREVRLRNVPFIQQLPQTVAEQDVNNVFRFQGDHPLALGGGPCGFQAFGIPIVNRRYSCAKPCVIIAKIISSLLN